MTPLERLTGRERLALGILVVAVVVGLSLWIHAVALPIPAVSDEAIYLWQARLLASGELTAPAPPHPGAFKLPGLLVHDGKRLSQYPIGYPLALAPWVRAGIPWALNVLLAGLSVLLYHGLARRIDGRGAAWVGTLLLSLSPYFVSVSTLFLGHTLTLFLTLVLLVALRRREVAGGSARWAACAGAAVGYALNVSPFVAVPMLLVAFERGLAARRARPLRRREVLAFALPILAGGALFCGVNLATTGSPWRPAYYLQSWVRAGFGEGIGRRVPMPSEEGRIEFSPRDALSLTGVRLASLNKSLFGWPVSSLAFAIGYLVYAGARRRARSGRGERTAMNEDPARDRWDRPLLLLFLGTLAVYFFWYHHGLLGEMMGPRYLFGALPTVVVFTARGVAGFAALASRISGPERRGPALGPRVAGLLLAVLVAAGTVPYYARLPGDEANRIRRGAQDLFEELDRRGIREGTVFIRALITYQAAPLLYASDFEGTGPLVFAKDRGAEANEELLRSRGVGRVYHARMEEKTYGWVLTEETSLEK